MNGNYIFDLLLHTLLFSYLFMQFRQVSPKTGSSKSSLKPRHVKQNEKNSPKIPLIQFPQ